MTRTHLLRLIEIFGPDAKLVEVQQTLEFIVEMGLLLQEKNNAH